MKNMFFSHKQVRGSHDFSESNNNDIEKCVESYH